LAAVLAVSLSAACQESNTKRCADLVCPADTVCSQEHGRCLDPDQLEACAGKGEGDECTIADSDGRCVNGLCIPIGCGDAVKNGLEECDGADLGEVDDCTDLGYYDTGSVTCGLDCRFDRSACSGICGDGEKNGNEACDGADLGGASCLTQGYYDEAGLSCNPASCAFDTSACTGFEKTYRLQPALAGSITVTLTDMTRDVDLLVLAATGPGACNPRNPGCLATSANTGAADESITFAAEAGETYFLVVDSYGYRNASYTLSVSCP
jgi:hypothetical protein